MRGKMEMQGYIEDEGGGGDGDREVRGRKK